MNALGVVCGKMPKVAKTSAPAGTANQDLDLDPNGKSIQQCQEAFARNKQACDLRGNAPSISSCYLQIQAAQTACLSLAAPKDGGTGKAKFVAVNKVYKEANDNSAANTVCEASPGDTADVVAKGPDNWVQLANISGNCGGKSGFVWNDGELQLP